MPPAPARSPWPSCILAHISDFRRVRRIYSMMTIVLHQGRPPSILRILTRIWSTRHGRRTWNDPQHHGNFDPVESFPIHSAMTPSAPLSAASHQPRPTDAGETPIQNRRRTSTRPTSRRLPAVPSPHTLTSGDRTRGVDEAANPGPGAVMSSHGRERRQRAFSGPGCGP